MDEYVVGVREWHNHTTLHPVGLISVLVLGVLLVLLPRRYAMLPMIVLVCFIPSAQRLIVFGADFTLLRILVVFGWARLFLRNEFQGLVWNKLDTLMTVWIATAAIIITLRIQTVSVAINQCGNILDALGMYFLFRCILCDWRDIETMIRSFALVSIPVALLFLVERMTGRNLFSAFGGVPAVTIVREGSLRCQGAYSHAILAGTFWASMLPLFFSIWGSSRKAAVTATVTSIIIVLTCASSTPVMSVGFVLIGLGLYPVRQYVRAIRWAFFLSLVVIHLSWNRPVWYLIAKMNVISGSTGYHRYAILDATINNFSKWWLCGDSDLKSWGVWQMRDVTNQYIATAVNGGLLSLMLFIAAISAGFGIVGRALRQFKELPGRRMTIWCVGVVLFVHVCTFFAVTYFGQIIMLIYLSFALCGSLQQITVRSLHQYPDLMTQNERDLSNTTLKCESPKRYFGPKH